MSSLTDKIDLQFDENPIATSSNKEKEQIDFSKLNPAYFNRGKKNKQNSLNNPNEVISTINSAGTSLLANSLAGDYVYQGQNQSTPNPFASDYFNAKWMGIDFGEVTNKHKDTSRGIDPYSRAVNFELLRRNEQSNAGALANMLTQYVGKTAINVVGGVVGGFYSLGAAAVQGLKNLGEDDETQPSALALLFDNSVNRALDRGTAAVESGNSVFTSQKAREQLGLFTVENAKDVSDAYSFISGAVISELILQAGSGGLASLSLPARIMSKVGKAGQAIKGIGLSKNLQSTGNYITRAEEAARLATSADLKDVKKLELLAKHFGTSVDDIIRYKRTLNSFDNVVRGGRQIVSGTMWEAGLEARHSYDGLMETETKKLEHDMESMEFKSEEEKTAFKEKELKRIKEFAETAGQWTFGLNVGVLGVSNHIQFPTIFGAKNVIKPDGLKGAFKKNAVGEYVKSGGKLSDIVRITGTALKSPITEFTEETLQGAIDSGSQSYYESMVGTRTASGELIPGVANLGDAMMKGLKQAYGTEEGRHEGYIGALVGAIGIPLLKRNKAGKLRKFEMSGGIAESLRANRDRNEAMKEAVGFLGIDKYGEVLNYNKDNAILASLDTKKENVATYNNDEDTIEEIKNNKIFRHVKDRMDKGLESYLESDIEEIKNMTLDEYKTKFQKPDSYTQADKNYDIGVFAEKANIYKDAYKRVYEGLRAEDMNDNHMTKKLFDVLTYSLANEKIYKNNQDKLITELLGNKDLEMTRSELINYAKYSEAFKDYENEIDDLAKEIKKAKVDAFNEKVAPFKEKMTALRGKVSEKNQKLIDDLLSGNEEASSYIDSVNKLKESFESDSYKDLAEDTTSISNIREELERTHKELSELELNRNKETRFSKSQFGSKTREMIDKKGEILNKINEEEYTRVRKSLELLKGKSTKVTQTELEEYFKLKEKVNWALAQKEDSEISFMDQIVFNKNVDLKVQLNSLAKITAAQTLALKIATNLYGLNKVNNSFGIIVNATLRKSSEDVETEIAMAHHAFKTFDEDLIAETQAKLEVSLKAMSEDLDEFKESLSEESIVNIEQVIANGEKVNSLLKEFLNISDEKEGNLEKTKEEEEAEREEKAIKAITKKEKKDKVEEGILDKEEEGIIEGEEFDNSSPNLSKNLHTIKNVTPSHKDQIILKAKTESGAIKYNSGAVLSYLEQNETTPELIKLLEKEKVKESYFKGKIKIADNPELLNEEFENLDADVKNFIAYAPVKFTIYDSEVSIVDGEQHFEVDEDTPISHSFLYYSPRFKSNNTVEDYKERKEAIIKKAKEEKSKLYKLLKGKDVDVDNSSAIDDIERKITKVISSEIVKKGVKKGQTRTITQTNSIEDVEGTPVSVTEYEAKVGDTAVSLEGRTMTFKEFKEEFPLDEDYAEILESYEDLNDDSIIVVRKVKRTPTSSRFNSVVSIYSPVIGGKMDVEIKKDDAKYDAELSAYRPGSLSKTQSKIGPISKEEYAKRKAVIEKNLQIGLADIEAKAFNELNNTNELALFKFRKALLYNKFGESGLNELKMRLGNIINGYLEKYGDTEYEVEEYALNDKENWLIQNIENIDWNSLMYGNQKGQYIDFEGKQVKINRGSRLNKGNAINSRLYLRYKTINNQTIPVLLNRARLNSNEDVFNEILYQLEKYFDKKSPNDEITIKNKKLKFLEGKTYKEFFASFMDINNSNSRFDGSLATFNIIQGEGEKANNVILGNFNVEIKDKKDFIENKAEIAKAIGSMRFYLDAISLQKRGNLNKEFLDFIIENKLINHSINASKNNDRIFNKKDNEGNDFVKSIQFHPLNTQFKISKVKKPRVNDIYSVRNKIFGSNDKSNLALKNVFYNINAAINTEARKVYRADDDISPEEAIIEAFNNVLTKKEEEILELAKVYPREYTEGLELKLKSDKGITFPKDAKSRKAIDNALRVLYLYKNFVRESNQEVFSAFIEYLKNADYESDFKKILIDPTIARVKLIEHEEVESSIEDEDGESMSKIQFKLLQPEELSSGTKEENKQAITNILQGFKRFKASVELFSKAIYDANKIRGKKQPNSTKIFFDFSKIYTNLDGSKEYVTVLNHKYDNKQKSVKTENLKEAEYNNIANYTSKEGVVHKPVRFFIQKNGKEVEVTDIDDFKYNSNGTLSNGIVRVYYSDAKGFVHNNAALVGTENEVFTNEYMASIKLPGLNNDFSINEDSLEKIESLMSSFQVKFSKINKATIDPHIGKTYMNDKVDLKEMSEEDEDDFLAEKAEALKKPFATKPKSEINEDEDFSFISDDESPVDNFIQENPNDGSSAVDVINALNEKALPTKEEKEKSDKVKSKLTKDELREFRADKKQWSRRIDKFIAAKGENFIPVLAKENINTYEDFKHMLTFVYSQDVDIFKKYITFAQKLFNVKDENIFKC